LIPCTK